LTSGLCALLAASFPASISFRLAWASCYIAAASSLLILSAKAAGAHNSALSANAVREARDFMGELQPDDGDTRAQQSACPIGTRELVDCGLRGSSAPYAPMPDSEFSARALERALKALGPEELATRLQAPPELIQTWINGHATMPERKFLRLVDVLDDIGE
jgi:hypothetical protein